MKQIGEEVMPKGMYLDRVRERLAETNLVSPGEFVPCTEEEVGDLELQMGTTFPAAYREFLLWMGHDASRLLAGSDYRCRQLPKLREWAVGLLSDWKFPQALPPDAVVFLMHQGYQFMFFKTSEGNDPAVYYYNETTHREAFSLFSSTFSEFLLGLVESFANLPEE
jgi:hypothetical protein